MNRIPRWVKWTAGLLLLGGTLLSLFPTCACGSRENARRTSCQSNLKQIALACMQYLQDYDERYPLNSNRKGQGWVDLLYPYAKHAEIFQCPSATYKDTKLRTDYFYNSRASHLFIANYEHIERTVILGDGQDNGASNTSLPELPLDWKIDTNSSAWRHMKGANYAFGDGHVKWVKPQNILTFKPSRMGQSMYFFAFKNSVPANQSLHPAKPRHPAERP